ncbi:MAG: ComEC/Rec2 family competence protein [Flavobacteriaceae bacterium]|nr:ComEC/Rec2 family competence protein [Candidatus Onthonaster equi]
MKNHLFSFLTICLAIGIFISDSWINYANLRIYFIFLLFTLFFNQLIKNHIFKTIGFCVQFILLGIILHTTINAAANEPYIPAKEKKVAQYVIIENYKASAKYLKFKGRNLVNGNVGLLHVEDKSLKIYPKDTLVIYGNTYELNEAKNPYQFNYSMFLKKQKINHTIYVEHVLKHKSNHSHWKKIATKSKENIRILLEKAGYSLEARSIISSMLLGDRSEISQELNDSYIATGVVHILSISGLHVVMIFMILQFILKPLLYLRNGKKIRIIIALLIIWLFAFYVDMLPPVFRSALMISIYYTSELLKRPKNIFHTISLSAFIILLIQPNYLFDVGFQLSFSAVFFIVWLNPIYKKLYKPKNKKVKYFYDLSTTSISAQLGTMPFATYYFNQFSGLFLFGNVFLVPASFLMILGAILAIILVLLNIQLTLYVNFFNAFIYYSNAYIKWLASHETMIMKQVYISPFIAFLIIIILIAIKPLILNKSKVSLYVIVACLLGIQINRYMDFNSIKNSNEVIIFHQYRTSLIGIRNGHELTILHAHNLDSSQTKQYIIRPYQIHQRIKHTTYIALDSVYENNYFHKTKSFLFVNNETYFIGENLSKNPENVDYILVRNSSYKPEDLKDLKQIKRVIADGSNYPSYISEMDSILKLNNHSILWNTSEKGSFQIRF